jgi:hypothetical protein
MVELEPVAHLRFQLAAFHMPASCVKQKSITGRGMVLRQRRSQNEVPVCTDKNESLVENYSEWYCAQFL